MDNQLSKRTFAQIFLALVVAAIAVSPPTAGAGLSAQFGAATNFPCVSSPQSLIAADFNHDGKPDIVVAGYGTVGVLRGLGNGAFGAQTNYFLSTQHGLAAGDFNNDGNNDLIGLNYSDGSVLLGDGKGNFPARTNLSLYYPAGYPSGMAIADFNGDGKLDLAIADDTYRYVAIALGRGDGSFVLPTTNYFALTNQPSGVNAVDINGNGRLDLVVSLGENSTSTNSFCVILNKGDGTFVAPQYYAAGSNGDYHESLELGDFNNDGKLDISVLNYNAKSVTIWLNAGTGNFALAHGYALGFSPTTIAGGDFNGDGKTDLVIRGGLAAKVLLGSGDGSFTVGNQMSVPDDVESTYGDHHGATKGIVVNDFDGNGTPDLAFVNYSSNAVTIMLNQTPPILQFALLAGYNQITWLAGFGAGYTLEYTTNLSTPDGWQPFPYPPVVIGNQKAVADWATGEQKFYRLRKP